jgi:hypothetical protein
MTPWFSPCGRHGAARVERQPNPGRAFAARDRGGSGFRGVYHRVGQGSGRAAQSIPRFYASSPYSAAGFRCAIKSSAEPMSLMIWSTAARRSFQGQLKKL